MSTSPRSNPVGGRRSRGGLTLLELVMVVSILAILTALVVPGMSDQNEETRRVVARATMQEVRDLIANRYANDMGGATNTRGLPEPNSLDTLRTATTQTDGTVDGSVPQLHFLFVNPNQYSSTTTVQQYVSVSDYDPSTRLGWNGPYIPTKSTVYPDPTARRFPTDPNNTETWAQYGFTTLYGRAGDYCVMDPWGSPYVIHIAQTSHGGSTLYTAYLVSAGFNRRLNIANWTFNTDGTLNTGDDLALQIKAWK